MDGILVGNMRKAARAIILRDDQLLIMNRNKFGKIYDTLPGGNLRAGELPEEALSRELKEETGLDVNKPRLVFIEEAGDPYGTQYIFECSYLGGEPELSPNSEEAAINKLGKNLYHPMWVELKTLPERPFLSEQLKQRILHAIENGFPEKVETFRAA